MLTVSHEVTGLVNESATHSSVYPLVSRTYLGGSKRLATGIGLFLDTRPSMGTRLEDYSKAYQKWPQSRKVFFHKEWQHLETHCAVQVVQKNRYHEGLR